MPPAGPRRTPPERGPAEIDEGSTGCRASRPRPGKGTDQREHAPQPETGEDGIRAGRRCGLGGVGQKSGLRRGSADRSRRLRGGRREFPAAQVVQWQFQGIGEGQQTGQIRQGVAGVTKLKKSINFADKAVNNLYFLCPASVCLFYRFMDKDFFNQCI